jgi:hypothetical protein
MSTEVLARHSGAEAAPALTPAPPAPETRRWPISSTLADVYGVVTSWDAFDFASIITLLLLLLYGGNYWYLKVPLTILCVVGMLHPPLRRSTELWVCASAMLVIANARNWYLIDNHKYLITYWSIAMAAVAGLADREAALRRNARLLIGLAFAFATLWKVMSPDFGDSTFFHHALLLDDRFAVLARWVGLPADTLSANQDAVKSLTKFDGRLDSVTLQTTPAVEALAWFLTLWTFGIEGLVALAFLCPEDRGPSRGRDIVLLLFLMSTYGIAPVIGFGWVLAIMGAVQASSRFRWARLAYVAVFVVLQLFRIPWKTFVS